MSLDYKYRTLQDAEREVAQARTIAIPDGYMFDARAEMVPWAYGQKPDVIFTPKRLCGDVYKPFYSYMQCREETPYRTEETFYRKYIATFDNSVALQYFFAVDAMYPFPEDEDGVSIVNWYTLDQTDDGRFYCRYFITHNHLTYANGRLHDSKEEARTLFERYNYNARYCSPEDFEHMKQKRLDENKRYHADKQVHE